MLLCTRGWALISLELKRAGPCESSARPQGGAISVLVPTCAYRSERGSPLPVLGESDSHTGGGGPAGKYALLVLAADELAGCCLGVEAKGFA